MTTSRFDFDRVKKHHGPAVALLRWILMVAAFCTTRGPLGKRLLANQDRIDFWVIAFVLLSVAVAVVAAILPIKLLILFSALFIWRIFDLNIVHLHILIVDRTNMSDAGYKSAVRSFVLSGINLFELIFAGLVIEIMLLKLGAISCIFDEKRMGSRLELHDVRKLIIDHIYNSAGFNSVNSECLISSFGVSYAYLYSFSIYFLVLVVIARAISAIKFDDRSQSGGMGASGHDQGKGSQ